MALHYPTICSRVMRAAKCSRDDAWSAIATVYARERLDDNRSEGEQANWLVKASYYAVLQDKMDRFKDECRFVGTVPAEDEDALDLWDTIPTPIDDDDIASELRRDMLRACREQYRVGLAVVLHNIFESRYRGALTIEAIRQILRRAGVTKAATDQATQIYTFLKTYNYKG